MNHVDDIHEAKADAWLVVWAESRAEKMVEKRIAAMGLVVWLPIIRERHRWSDRWREVECPLFPGYLFVRAQDADWPHVLRTPGVLTVVKEGGRPARVPGNVVSSLRDALNRDGATPEPIGDPVNYQLGEEVVVQEGVLSGVKGIVRELKSRRQLVIWVGQIGRGVAFTIGSALVKAAQPACRPA